MSCGLLILERIPLIACVQLEIVINLSFQAFSSSCQNLKQQLRTPHVDLAIMLSLKEIRKDLPPCQKKSCTVGGLGYIELGPFLHEKILQ